MRLALAAVCLAACTGKARIVEHWDRAAVERGSKIAIIAVNDDMDQAVAIESALLDIGLRVVDRSTFSSLIEEQRLGTTGAIRPKDAQSIGQMSGAQYIMMYSRGSLRLLSVVQGEVVAAKSCRGVLIQTCVAKLIFRNP